MSDADSHSPPPAREGFERRWIDDANYTGPERRSGQDRRRYPPIKDKKPGSDRRPEPEADASTSESLPRQPQDPKPFKPYRP